MRAKFSSFDVFDTVLTRSYAVPEDLHWHLAELAAQRGLVATPAALVQARRQAETLAWQRAGHARAIGIEGIYRGVGALLGTSESDTASLMALELDLESACVRPVAAMAAELRVRRARGERICFLSDMHLPAAHIRLLLEKCRLIGPEDHLFVSSDEGVSKRSAGRLYRRALGALGLWPWQLHHQGDDRRADVRMAWLRGVPATHRRAASLNRFEHALLALPAPDDWRARGAVSASKFARLSRHEPGPGQARWDLLCSTIAPFVAGYALWLIEQAKQQGLRALFFMARDMQIVCEVAAAIARAQGLALQCVYIHASRTAWQPAGYRGDEFDLFWLADQLASAEPTQALNRLLDAPTVEALHRGGHLQVPPAALGHRELTARWLRLPAVAQAVEHEVARRRGLLLNYLRQRGFTPDGRCALVDAGWRGTLQKCLARAYVAQGVQPVIPAFYIGLRHQVAPEPGSTMQAYVADADARRLGYSLVAMVEAFLTANHGTTLGYRAAADGTAEAVLGPKPPAAILQQCSDVRSACMAHVGELLALPALPALCGAQRLPSLALARPLLALCAEPTRQDAAVLRRWLVDTGRATPLLKPLVSSLSLKDMAKLVRARWRRTAQADVYLSGPWLHGSLALANGLARRVARWLLAPARA
jgi:FMN phosphatase YigB (HAD superfamily)